MNKTILVETIFACDENGNHYTLNVWQKMIEAVTLRGTTWIPGLKRVIDQNGHHVNVVEDGFFGR